MRLRFFMKASPVGKISSSLKVGLRALRGRIHLICHTITLSPKEKKWRSSFFTTKLAEEGTGLGPSISHDIIVKQHGGTIEVETQPGEYTEFRIVLPRAAAFASGART